ncbi:hypothetical protein AMV129 [Betaentomopoxvirus amoorei]|uniref:AMV129 n=1 Tax=Amsacta moorei entomopoxvirus TaxID=28321 RepID=Q9EMS0_AMEPV|nr:hypothetical protein AMV129 [Amsacta moorei entomopoxvirus]AAG02835.1 AMV129 [Amsacta moorei entomopoxvirus]
MCNIIMKLKALIIVNIFNFHINNIFCNKKNKIDIKYAIIEEEYVMEECVVEYIDCYIEKII